jgi:DNA-binding CsgD family transcriptional regulator
VVDEIDAVMAATGNQIAPYGGFGLVAWTGSEAEAEAMCEATITEAVPRGEGIALSAIGWTRAFQHNRAGRYAEAIAAAEQALQYPVPMLYRRWALIELVLAAAACGDTGRAADALEQLTQTTRAAGTDWALGIEARARALVSEGEAADRWFREAIERLGRTGIGAELARTHLLYGEWLAREQGRGAGRDHLRIAHERFTAMGAEAFAARALGTQRRPRGPEEGDLTTQEARIARLARDGLSNAEIGARLYISPRTVEYHLSKVFGKLEISSRTELGRLPATTTSTS